MQRKAQIWISAVIYVLIIVTALVIILATTQPLLDRMKDKATVQKQKDTMTALDEQISGVAAEGPGSQRVVPIDITGGKIAVSGDSLTYSAETDTKVIEPSTQLTAGNLVIGSGTDVKAYTQNSSYFLENSRIRVEMIKTNNLSSTSQTIKNITLLETNTTATETFSFDVGGGTSLLDGSYTKMEKEGNNLAMATVVAHCNQTIDSINNEYDLVFTLESEADFIKVDLENLVRR